jgi:hypothetical protein
LRKAFYHLRPKPTASEMLTPSERASLPQHAKGATDYGQRAFAHVRKKQVA